MRTQEVKERVADAKRQLGEILKASGSVVAAIREYEAYINEGAKVRAEVLEKVQPAHYRSFWPVFPGGLTGR